MDMTRVVPWDAVPHWSAPQERFIIGAVGGAVIAPYDITRVYLMIGVPSTVTTPITMMPGVTSNEGFVLQPSAPFIVLTYEDHGPLCMAAWYAGASGGVNFTVVTCSLVSEFSESGDPLAAIKSGRPTPPQRISTAPGVGGGKGLLDYWAKLVAKFGGKG